MDLCLLCSMTYSITVERMFSFPRLYYISFGVIFSDLLHIKSFFNLSIESSGIIMLICFIFHLRFTFLSQKAHPFSRDLCKSNYHKSTLKNILFFDEVYAQCTCTMYNALVHFFVISNKGSFYMSPAVPSPFSYTICCKSHIW